MSTFKCPNCLMNTSRQGSSISCDGCNKDVHLTCVGLSADEVRVTRNIHAPLRTARVCKPFAHWLTQNLRAIFKQRDAALIKYKHNRTNQNWTEYTELRNYALASKRREKAGYLQHIQETNNSSSLYKGIRNLNMQAKKRNHIPVSLRNATQIMIKYARPYLGPLKNVSHIKKWFRAPKNGARSLKFRIPVCMNDKGVVKTTFRLADS
ncbi:unnamed protein product [Acanthoscelides obtectus]|uniref:Zinc finger PHD-type domain-containing protein n=1 Tax=Acanthoscelides obtectus TaxID=200917 RepID=A0A9P0PB18_ACAOB|nr:unnamed protein product [Acanthoscelides obtectus]CAK1640006.1 hypothetical protein AOBTE_LOCUS11500 [Acanthoscelides obtectus]